ncbi:MAG: 4-(cytidine 5'-diphospho)-2-C-methyl-D-erythritol kinase [Acidobacteria bacterium]|nr:4-(cytidine 5'-diphospho)-2-C-methyl-D-erythritol kinase [Acidobacteriota bacterium]
MTVEVLAPAKLTLSLRVTGRRDDGFHLLDAEMVSLDLVDVLRIRPVDGPSSLRVVGPEGPRRTDPDDLVLRALAHCGRSAEVDLEKRIPAGAGLGGGSSDAAAVLRWAAGNDPAGVDPVDAARLGADVAFCVRGGRARVRGIGEQLEPLPFVERTLTLLTPALHCSTPVVYRTWDELGGPTGGSGNDLEPAALAAYPELADARDELAAATGLQPRLAGSGSTWFVEGDFPGPGRLVAHTTPAFGV